MEGSRLSRISIRAVYTIYLALCLVLLCFFWRSPPTLLFALCAGAAVLFLSRPLGGAAERLGGGRCLALLLALCLFLRLAVIWRVRIQAAGDDRVFLDTARFLAQHDAATFDRYMALFPHIFGYSYFLSRFMKLFGDTPLLAPVLNAILSTVSAWLIFRFCNGLSGLRPAVTATLLWCFLPSQILYNCYAFSEPLYTMLLLAFFNLVLRFAARREDGPRWEGLLWGAGAGALLACFNMVRPLGPIPIVALALWLGLVRWRSWRRPAFRWRWLAFFLALLVCFQGGCGLGRRALNAKLGGEAAVTPGFNILVGLNARSRGQWTEEDGALLDEVKGDLSLTSEQVQREMLRLAAERAASGEINYPRLALDKLEVLLGRDDACVDYGGAVFRHQSALSRLCNAYYEMCVLLSALGAWAAWRRREGSPLLLPALFALGLTAAHMLTEVAPRYHYALLPCLILLAACGIEALHARRPGAGPQTDG